VAEETQRAPVLRCGLLGGPHVLAVGLVDGERVGQLEDALLDALELVARAREHEDRKKSTIEATANSDCPTPTVSTSTAS